MIKCEDIVEFMEKLAPSELADEWDNVGLLIGSSKKSIGRLMVSLDITSKVVKEAIDSQVDMIVSHHPVIFKKLSRITDETRNGDDILSLIKHGVCVYAAHTNLDAAYGGVNDCLASAIGLKNILPLGGMRLGRTGTLEKPQELGTFMRHLKNSLGLKMVRVVGGMDKKVLRAAVFSGSYDDRILDVVSREADVLVTGDIKYHQALKIEEMGFCAIDVGHFGSERVAVPKLAELISKQFNNIEVFTANNENDPYRFY